MSRRRDNSYWTEARLAILRRSWDEGLSVNAIARRMGISKNTVVGKAHRLRLPPRPSPIIRDGYVPPGRSVALHAPAVTLSPLASVTEKVTLLPEDNGVPRSSGPKKVTLLPGTGKCLFPRWPHGAPPTHEYCGQRTPLGSSWCPECRRLVWARRAA